MGNFTYKSLQYLYNELSEEEATAFKITLFSDAKLEKELLFLKQGKEILDEYYPMKSPSVFTINKIIESVKDL